MTYPSSLQLALTRLHNSSAKLPDLIIMFILTPFSAGKKPASGLASLVVITRAPA